MIEVLPYQNEDLGFEERAKDLVSRMTLTEKISQLIFKSPAVNRLGITAYNWWNEALHGVARAGTATIFPQAIGLAACFDDEFLYRIADVISTEGRAKYHEFHRKEDYDIYKGLTFWSPNINIFRDPRWGRGHETYGEDPFLSARLGVAFIKGLQGDHERYLKTAACAKHFAVHSGPENERHSFNAVVSAKDLYETYLYAFKCCVKEGNVEAVMGAYNRTNGEPCCGSQFLLKTILRENWRFNGHIVSDCWAIKDFHEFHKVTNTPAESAALALNNGCDLNCGNIYSSLGQALNGGLITEETITQSVTRLLITRMKLGMFDKPERNPYSQIPYTINDCPEHHELALEAARRSLVLLKNDNHLLPFNRSTIKSIAVIGPNADSRDALIGNYFGTASHYVTVLEGIRQVIGNNVRIYYSQGCHLYKERLSNHSQPNDRLTEAVSVAEQSDLVVLCLGLDALIEGEEGDVSNEYAAGDKLHLNLPGFQQELLEAVYRCGKPVILVLLSGSALSVTWADQHIPAIIQAWYPGAEGGKAIAELIFGSFSPSGRLPVTFYRTTEELPDFKDYSMKNRTYRYHEGEALYPFGYGLSYTAFSYMNLTLSKQQIQAGKSLDCAVTVKNTGSYASYETVQLYLHDIEASVILPHWQLCGFKSVFLKPGEEKELQFQIAPRQMALITDNGDCLLEPGRFRLYIGGGQPDSRTQTLTGTKVLSADFEVTGKPLQIEY